MYEIHIIGEYELKKLRRFGLLEYQEPRGIRDEIEKHVRRSMSPFEQKIKNKKYDDVEKEEIVRGLRQIAGWLIGQYELQGVLDTLIGDIEKRGVNLDRSSSTEVYYFFIMSIIENGKFTGKS